MVPTFWVHFPECCPDCVSRDIFDFRNNILNEVTFEFWELLIKIPLEFVVSKFISCFVATIVWGVFLDCVIG